MQGWNNHIQRKDENILKKGEENVLENKIVGADLVLLLRQIRNEIIIQYLRNYY